MGNKTSQGPSTTLGHSSADMAAPKNKPERTQSRRAKFLNVFSVQTIGKALSSKKKKNAETIQVHQPAQFAENSPKPPEQSFSPVDFAEITKQYEIDWAKSGFLGQGHYASVYRGQNLFTKQMVAVKKVSKKLTREDSLKSEVEALRKVSGHPNIVNLFDVYLDTEHMYLVLELLAGGELFDRIVSTGAYSERDAAAHMKTIGSALKHMHSRGIVHRDLKPENLVLVDNTPHSPIKISDFGLSKILKDDEEVMMTICGTKAYSAPEVGFGFRQAGIARTDQGYSAKVDMWSLGVIIFVIVAAYHPFDPQGCDDDRTIWSRIVAGKWDFNDKVWDSLSEMLKDLLRKLINPDPEKRLSAEEFLEHPWITDVSTPVRPLPSLTRARSSRYWHVQDGSMIPVTETPRPAPITESASSGIDGPFVGAADGSKSDGTSTGESEKETVDPDHHIV